ncbi:5'-3' exonuclease [Candidatus Parcubacteria bacterium]|nr:5'-3' exonuclease [Candidatus Parcubacteria bacterium]
MSEKILILDSNSVLHRAFHALPPLCTKEGFPTGAIYGFFLLLFKLLKEKNPQYFAFCFDFPAKTFRHQKFKNYKAQRPKTSQELVFQIQKTKEILDAFSFPIFEKEGFEADDLIGTLVEKLPSNLEKIIVSGDSDVFQLIRKDVKVYFLGKNKTEVLFDEKKVKEKFFGILPSQIPDFKALVGDASDNISGVSGVGEKTGAFLISKYKTAQNLLENIQKDPEIKDSTKKAILKEKEKILENLELLKIRKDLDLSFSLDQLKWQGYNKEKVIALFEKLEFKSLIKRLPEIEKFQKTPKPLSLL